MPEELTETNYPPGTLYDPESPEERFEPGSAAEEAGEKPAEQFGTIEDAGSPTDNRPREKVRKAKRRKAQSRKDQVAAK